MDMTRVWYHSFCTEKEIDRILNPKTAEDFLLKKRADIIADHPRYTRVYLRLSELPTYSSLENSFNKKHYHRFLLKLSKNDRELCDKVVYGDVFSNDFNGYATRHEKWGNILYINNCLQMFCNFINLALLDFEEEVPLEVRVNALRIAIRISMKNESMDFALDPRGIIPIGISKELNKLAELQLQNIAGHEFCHFLCGHLDNSTLIKAETFSLSDKKYYDDVYNVSQQNEFEADLASLTRPNYNTKEIILLTRALLIWFISLDIVEYSCEIYSPTSNFCIKTHPSAKDRYDYILSHMEKIDKSLLQELNDIKHRAEILKEFLKEDMSLNFDMYEMYGSVYLDKPNTNWRGRELIDRKDY